MVTQAVFHKSESELFLIVYSKQGFHLQLRVEKEKMMASKKGGLAAVTAANRYYRR